MDPIKDDTAEPITREEVKALFQQFGRAVAALKIFPPLHPNAVKFRADFLEHLHSFIRVHGRLEIRVEGTAFWYKEEAVYRDDSINKSLPYLFFKDGIQKLGFKSGIAEKELEEFLNIVLEASLLPTEESDIAMALWERDFENIEYVVPDDFLETKIPILTKNAFDFSVDPAVLYGGRIELAPDDMEDIYKRSLVIAAKERKEDLDYAHLITSFDDRDRRKIDSLLALERAVPLEREFVETIYEMVSIEDRPDAYSGLLGFVENYLDELVQKGRFLHAERLLRNLDELLAGFLLSAPPKVQPLSRLLVRLRENLPLGALAEQFAQGRMDDIGAFFRFLERIGPRTLPLGADLFDSIRDGEARSEAYAFMKFLGLRFPDILINQARESRPFLSKGIIHLLVDSNDLKVLPSLARFRTFKDPSIRLEAARGLGRIDNSLADKLLLQYLEDEDEAVRIAAVEGLHPRPDPAFLRPILEIVEARNFGDKSGEEKAAWLSFLGRTRTEAARGLLERLLTRTSKVSPARTKDTRLAAVRGLEIMATVEAVEVLKKGTAEADAVGAACRAAVEHLGRTPSGETR